MGCCFSLHAQHRQRSSPFTTETAEERHADPSPRGMNPAATTILSEPTASLRHHPSSLPAVETTSRPRRSSRRRSQPIHLSLSEHYNQPIRPHIWRSKHRLWTRSELTSERSEFFETRVTGRPEVWAALSTAISLLRGGDVSTAQGIIDAAGVTVPTGDLCEGCYDETGALYRLPHCIVSDPENVVGDQTVEHGDAMSDGKLSVSDESEDELSPGDIERRREEKGKMNERDVIKVRARLSDRGGPDIVISVSKLQGVGVLARKIEAEAGISSGKQQVRVAYLGRILKEHEPILDQGWKPGHIVNALVVALPSAPS